MNYFYSYLSKIMLLNSDIIQYMALTELTYPEIINLSCTNSKYNNCLCKNYYFMKNLYERDFGDFYNIYKDPIAKYRKMYLDKLINKIIITRNSERFNKLIRLKFNFKPYIDIILEIGQKYRLITSNIINEPMPINLFSVLVPKIRWPNVFTKEELPFLNYLIKEKVVNDNYYEWFGYYYIVPPESKYNKIKLEDTSFYRKKIPILSL